MDNKALDLDNKKSFMAAPTYPLNMGATFQLFQRQPRENNRAQPQLQRVDMATKLQQLRNLLASSCIQVNIDSIAGVLLNDSS